MRRILQLDGLRGLAILMVFVYHAFKVPLLWSGVDLFFILSGYLITGILLRLKDQKTAANMPSGPTYWKPFYLKRARRILPPYLFFLLIVGFFFPIQWSHVWYWYAFFGANVASALGLVMVEAIAPLWSLAVEEQFYLLWPSVVLKASSKQLKTIALSIIVAAPILRALCTPLFHDRWPIYALPFFRFDTLAWGAFIAISEYCDSSWISRSRSLAGKGAVAAATILCGLSAFRFFRLTANTISFNTLAYSLIAITFGCVVIYVLGSQEDLVHWVLTRPALRYLGKISYTFYLYHLGVLFLVQRSINSSILAGLITFVITAAIASASWVVLESPILNWSTSKDHPAMQRRPIPSPELEG